MSWRRQISKLRKVFRRQTPADLNEEMRAHVELEEQENLEAGMPPEEAMLQAGRRRLRPIVMTALATVCGMLPLALALGAGSQMLQPLAIAVIGGILASMVLSLVVTPAVRYYFGR